MAALSFVSLVPRRVRAPGASVGRHVRHSIAIVAILAYDRGAAGAKAFDRILKVMVALIVLAFFGVVVKMSIEGALPWSEILAGFVPDVSLLTEPSQKYNAALAATGEYQDEAITVARALLVETEAGIVANLIASGERRTAAVADVPADVLVRYEKVRPSFGSSAVVRFSGSDCSGCPYSMPAMEADRVKFMAVGTLADCSECGRLVVR